MADNTTSQGQEEAAYGEIQLEFDLEPTETITVEYGGEGEVLPHGTVETLAEERKRLGRCVKCGDLLPMTAFGLGECVNTKYDSKIRASEYKPWENWWIGGVAGE